MKRFKTYLIAKRIVPEKRVPCYVSRVSRFYAFCNKNPGDDVSGTEIDQFLRHLNRSSEAWQIKQAKEAVDLYRFIHRKSTGPGNNALMDTDSRWKQVADETVRFPFFP